MYKYKIEVSTDNTNWTAKVDKTSNTINTQYQADSFTATARYVRITATGGLDSTHWHCLYELKVFGN